MRNCPQCAKKGRKISALTLASHVQPGRLREIENRDNWLLCLSPTCPTIYFHEERVVGANEVKVLPFHKATSSDRIVCFCFEHRACEIREEVLAKGHSTIRDSVRDACRAGLDDCERNNPQGRCCLGNIGLVVKDAESSTQSASSRSEPCCNS